MSVEKGVEFTPEWQQRLEQIKKQSEKGDVVYDLNRWFRDRMDKSDPELLEIQKQGFVSEALVWLKSTTPEGMKYGKATKEERLTRAREFAEKAGTTIETIAEERGFKFSE